MAIVNNLSTHKKHLGLVIVDGVGFRNYILSDFIKEAVDAFDVITIYSGLPMGVYKTMIPESIQIVELDDFREPSWTWFFRKLKEVAHLHKTKDGNFGITDNLKAAYPKGNSLRAILSRIIHRWTSIYHSEKWIQRYYSAQEYTFKKHPSTQRYLKLLKENAPDLLYFTHQRPPYIAPLLYAARIHTIRTGTFIFSWDNLASKGRMAGDFDFYFVWSHLMHSELLQFYSNINPEQIDVVGTPQFEPYVLERYKSAKEEFTSAFHLDPKLKTICYSCGDVATSRNDELYIDVIARAIESGRFSKKVNLLVRTSPAETPERFETIRLNYPWIQWNIPRWLLARECHSELWSQRVPMKDDAKELRMVLNYSDVGINMCSTMSLDFMQFDKPVINPVFGNLENGMYNDQRFLRFAHYKRVVESGAVYIARNEDELIKAIKESLEEPLIRVKEQRALLAVQTLTPLKGTSKRIVQTLIDRIE